VLLRRRGPLLSSLRRTKQSASRSEKCSNTISRIGNPWPAKDLNAVLSCLVDLGCDYDVGLRRIDADRLLRFEAREECGFQRDIKAIAMAHASYSLF